MKTDPAFAAECARIDALRRLMCAHLPREAPPPGLRSRRVETAVGMIAYARRLCARNLPGALAASIVVTAFVAGSSTSMFLASSQPATPRDRLLEWRKLPQEQSKWTPAKERGEQARRRRQSKHAVPRHPARPMTVCAR
jgi:hypothetical protein